MRGQLRHSQASSAQNCLYFSERQGNANRSRVPPIGFLHRQHLLLRKALRVVLETVPQNRSTKAGFYTFAPARLRRRRAAPPASEEQQPCLIAAVVYTPYFHGPMRVALPAFTHTDPAALSVRGIITVASSPVWHLQARVDSAPVPSLRGMQRYQAAYRRKRRSYC